jgi:hypothetical protein
MELLENIYRSILLNESVSEDEVNDALDNHKRVIINYHTKGEDKNTGARVIEVYAYGLTKAGNPCIRCFQPYGDTTSRVPSWKFFRLDRITAWQPTEQRFSRPADFYYKNLGDFNPNGDETMSVVYKVAKFGDETAESTPKTDEPKSKEDVYKTDTEYRMERLRQQLQNPIKLSDIKVNDAFKDLTTPKEKSSEPKTKEDVYKTDTERGMEKLRQQLQNPKKIDLSQFEKKPQQKSKEEKQKDLDKLRDVLKDKQQMSLSDLNARMKETPKDTQKPSELKDDLFKTDTEKGMENLRQQLQNPRKIDLSRIPRR